MSAIAMIPSWPAERRRRLALLVLAVVVLAGAVAVGLPLWFAHRHYDTALEDFGARLGRYERLEAARPVLEKRLEALKAQGSRKYFLKASASSLSAVEIQEKVRQFIEGNGGRLVSVQPGTARTDGRFRQVTVTIQANAGMNALRKILLQIESSEPYVLVESMTLRAQVPPGYKPPPGADPELFVQLDIVGFAIAP